MLLLKGCRRCHGDLFVENQTGITDLVCLQCGFRRTVGQTPPTVRAARLAPA
jgi:DNA-directed RNA polymerase subunit RPC12/RpoP